MQGIQLYLVVGAAIASALVGGVFYAFSSFVMAALQRLEPKDGMTAMQAINTTAVEPGLMVPFFGTTLAHIAVAITAISNWENGVSAWLLVGSLSYVLGTFALTAYTTFHETTPLPIPLSMIRMPPMFGTATLLNGPEEITSGRQRRWWRRLP